MNFVKPKKFLGQHFLKDEEISFKIVESLTLHRNYKQVLEIGPGTGVLSKYLLKKIEFETLFAEIDSESIVYLENNFPEIKKFLIKGDVLRIDLSSIFKNNFAIIGNFPYNISSQIMFKILDYHNQIDEVVGMFQKEVAQRIASKPGNKDYGILSVLLQAYYDIEYLFTVSEDSFIPPPKVKSGVIRLKRNDNIKLNCDEKLFKTIVKTAFNQRRKTLRNALKQFEFDFTLIDDSIFNKRAEQLSYIDFISITNSVKV